MVTALVFFLVIIVAFQYTKNPFAGILLYLGVVLFCPYITIGSISFRVELLQVPLLLLITLIRKRGRLVISPIFLIWILFVGYNFCISFINSAPNFDSKINIIAFYNYLRFGGLILIGANLDASIDDLQKFNKLFFYYSIPIALLALGLVLGNGAASLITRSFFTSPTRSVFTTQLDSIDAGYLFRSIGVFENVSYYASFILVILTLGITFILIGYRGFKPREKWIVVIAMIINLVAGISASSLTFYVGFGMLVIFFWIKRPVITTKIFVVSSIGGYLTIVLFFKNFLSANQQYIDSFTYLYQSLIGGNKISERYALSSRENGDLSNLVSNSWIQGNGFRVFDKIVVNDSLYLEFFYQGGAIGILLLLLFLRLIFLYSLRTPEIRSRRIYLIICILLVVGLGCNSFTIVRMSEWLWILFGMISVSTVRKDELRGAV